MRSRGPRSSCRLDDPAKQRSLALLANSFVVRQAAACLKVSRKNPTWLTNGIRQRRPATNDQVSLTAFVSYRQTAQLQTGYRPDLLVAEEARIDPRGSLCAACQPVAVAERQQAYGCQRSCPMRLRLTALSCSTAHLTPQKSLCCISKLACTAALLLSVLLLQPARCSPHNAASTPYFPDQLHHPASRQDHAADAMSDVQLNPKIHEGYHRIEGCKPAADLPCMDAGSKPEGVTKQRSLSEEDASPGRAAAGQHPDGRDKSRSTRSSRAHLRAGSGWLASETGAFMQPNASQQNFKQAPVSKFLGALDAATYL